MKRYLIFLLMTIVMVSLIAGTAFTKNMNKTGQGWLGISIQTVDHDLSEAFDLGVDYGALINEVFDGSPANDAKLMEEDVIISLNGEKVSDADDLLDLLEETNAGDKVVLVVVREGEKKKISVTVDERPDSFNKNSFRNNIRKSIKRSLFFDDDDGDNTNRFFFGNKTRGYLGVNLINLSDQLGDYFGVSDGEGVLVSSVESDSPAEKAGIKAGDVILSANKEKIENVNDLSSIVREHKEGDNITLVVLRDGRRKEIDCKVGETDSYSWFHNPNDVDVFVQKMPHSQDFDYYYRTDWDTDNFDFDKEDFDKSMEEFRKAMKDIEQLKDLKYDLDLNYQKEYKDEIKELKKELKQLKKELKKINRKLQ